MQTRRSSDLSLGAPTRSCGFTQSDAPTNKRVRTDVESIGLRSAWGGGGDDCLLSANMVALACLQTLCIFLLAALSHVAASNMGWLIFTYCSTWPHHHKHSLILSMTAMLAHICTHIVSGSVRTSTLLPPPPRPAPLVR